MERDEDASKPTSPQPRYQIADAQLAVEVASGKWVLPILELLAERGLRRSELRRRLGGDTHQKVLSLTLQRMTAAGLITRTLLRPTPPAVRYELTNRGREFFAPLAAMAAWAAADRNRLTGAVNHTDDPPEDDPSEPGSGMPEEAPQPSGGDRPTPGRAVRHALSPAIGRVHHRPGVTEVPT